MGSLSCTSSGNSEEEEESLASAMSEMRSMPIRIKPSLKSSRPSMMTIVASAVAIKSIGSSIFSIPSLIGIAEMSVVTPSTSAMFAMLEPKAFPTASVLAPSRAAMPDTISSGADVPNATMVRPTSIGVMPRLSAVATAPSTNLSALQIKIIKPIITAKLNTNNGYCSYKVLLKRAFCETYRYSASNKTCNCFV